LGFTPQFLRDLHLELFKNHRFVAFLRSYPNSMVAKKLITNYVNFGALCIPK
jgi:hypothetical protein